MTLGGITETLGKKPGDRALLIILIVGVLGLALSWVLFAPYFAILAPSGYSVVDQQTVFTYAANEAVLAAWKAIDGGIEASLMCAYIDLFPFMPAYAAVGFAGGVLLARRCSARTGRVGTFCALCIFPAWLADVVETGIQAIISLNVDSYPPLLVPVMSTAAVVKIVFFYASLLWCLVGSVIVLVRRLSPRQTT